MLQKKNMIHVAIVDDKKTIRNALEERFSQIDNYKISFTAENGIDFLEKMVEAKKSRIPDVILMDIDMPVMNGIEAVDKAKNIYPTCKILMLSIFDEDDKIFEAIKAGADGYLLKDETMEKIIEAINNLLNEGGAPMSPSIARKALQLLMNSKANTSTRPENNDLNVLTEREHEILKHLVNGLEYKEIGQLLSTSPNTIRNQISSIYKKLHVTSKVQAISLALKKRWF